MTKYYHVAPADHSGDLISLYDQLGEAAYAVYAERWPDAGELAQYHAHYVHMYATIEEARKHVNSGKIYEIDAEALEDECIEVEIDNLEFPHPMVRGVIPAHLLKEVE